MVSKFGWVDFAEDDRQKMLDVIHLFRERDTRDELGIGTIRDAFSDHFFPGTSTIQTRIRYMLFIPWIYLDYERLKVPSSKIAERARNKEIRLITALLGGGETEGVIGIDAKKTLKRLPSNIYWAGLGSWGIRLFKGSQDQYHRYLDTHYSQQTLEYGKEADDEVYNSQSATNWDPEIPKPPEDLMEASSLSLSSEEANYLRDRILILHPKTLLAAFLRKKRVIKTQFFWEQPLVESLPKNLRDDIMQARNFSEVMHGASLLYNLMLSENIRNEEWVDDYKDRLANWVDVIKIRLGDFIDWHRNIEAFWNSEALENALIPFQTKRFVNTWLDFVFDFPKLNRIVPNNSVRSTIVSREVFLKRNRARLSNKRALELWQGESGTNTNALIKFT